MEVRPTRVPCPTGHDAWMTRDRYPQPVSWKRLFARRQVPPMLAVATALFALWLFFSILGLLRH